MSSETQNNWTKPVLTGHGWLAAVICSYITGYNWLHALKYDVFNVMKRLHGTNNKKFMREMGNKTDEEGARGSAWGETPPHVHMWGTMLPSCLPWSALPCLAIMEAQLLCWGCGPWCWRCHGREHECPHPSMRGGALG